MRKEYDLRTLKVKRRGVVAGHNEPSAPASSGKKPIRNSVSGSAAKTAKRAARLRES